MLLLGTLALAAIVAEIGLRIVQYGHGRLSIEAFNQYDPLLGWRITPNADATIVTSDYRTHLKYGPKGLRGKDYPYVKPPGTYRIEVLGDSFVDGFSVPLEDRVSEVLERRLGRGNEVVNLGVSGYATDQELLMLESDGWKYQPDLVVLFFYYNDIWMNGQRLLSGATFKPVFKLDEAGNLVLTGVPVPQPAPTLEERFKLYALFRDAMRASTPLYDAITFHRYQKPPELPMPAGAGGTADQFRVYQTEETPELHRVWAITNALLKRMNGETQQHGGRLLVFYVPSPVELSAEEWKASSIPRNYASDVVLKHLVQICDSEGIALLDPSPRFREARKNGPLSYPHDVHWTKAGHSLAADLLTEYLHGTGAALAQAKLTNGNASAKK